ncbi:hypothetical protein [uncultured Chryseobacterium sp.]|uniref:hypothetical protein n=1 Tax=uncultured Chryseobacterium sp. TaxID=259322 RepID=UPI0026220386|nr:hypothetical protein [uncultured Chryseobacterium sp.]
MKKIILTFIIAIFSVGFASAQVKKIDWKKVSPEKRKEMINNMNPEERKELLKQFRENMLVEELNVEDEDQEEFKKVYNEYVDAQKKIKDQFDNNFNPDSLSDDEAKKKLEESFEVGQKLLDNRRAYSRKMQTVVRPQQVLKMFKNEGMMREKMIDRRIDGGRDNNSTRAGGGFRTPAPSRGR